MDKQFIIKTNDDLLKAYQKSSDAVFDKAFNLDILYETLSNPETDGYDFLQSVMDKTIRNLNESERAQFFNRILSKIVDNTKNINARVPKSKNIRSMMYGMDEYVYNPAILPDNQLVYRATLKDLSTADNFKFSKKYKFENINLVQEAIELESDGFTRFSGVREKYESDKTSGKDEFKTAIPRVKMKIMKFSNKNHFDKNFVK